MMVSGGITMDGLSKSNVYQYGVHGLRVKVNFALCVQCGQWIHGICAGVIQKCSRNFACRKCKRNIGVEVEQEETLCNEVHTER